METNQGFNKDWPVPQIDPQRCDGCSLCVQVCPNHVLVINQNIAVVALPDRCDYTGFCEQVCPQKAIQRLFEIILPANRDKKNN